MTGHDINITLSTASVFPRRAGFAFELASRLGYDGVEVMVWSESVTQDAVRLQNLSEHYNMPITSIHSPSLVVSQSVWGVRPARKLERSVHLAEQVGAKTVVVHPPFAWQSKYAETFAEHVKALSAATGITIAVENMYPWRSKRKDYVAYLPHWDLLTQHYDAVTVDLSHAGTAGQNSLELVRKLGGTVRHIHMADSTGSAKDEHLVPGVGDQPCLEVIEHLVNSHWHGDIAIEIGTRKADNAAHRVAMVREALEFTKAAIAGAPTPVPVVSLEEHAHERPTDAW
ncbi:sugar phosphate isomerase/epimerase family protein [Jonesia quinghaiensis]|uniref:sugar phosphate isomerase/epimerase family protein n=1 Tax=Jonesia quinghaiensis TaxID=262806 RepID=UPI000406B9A9|nr:sugar phosphate isomerase/epimerase [Jonesia quinghaiensis]